MPGGDHVIDHPPFRQRRNLRLGGYDYAQPGAYFLTICVHDRACLLGDIVDEEMRLNDAGQVIANTWKELPKRFATLTLDRFVVMPNHVHGILMIDVGRPYITHHRPGAAGEPTIGRIVGAFKSLTTVNYIRGVRQCAWTPFNGRLWQRNYYEHVIRDETSLNRIREYILQNPLRWAVDRENPAAVDPESVEAWLRAS